MQRIKTLYLSHSSFSVGERGTPAQQPAYPALKLAIIRRAKSYFANRNSRDGHLSAILITI